jgi:tRNA 2-thiouridine synthesizing protein E
MTAEKDYLDNLPIWSTKTAHQLAATDGIDIDENRLKILLVAREFYNRYGFSPSMRPLCKVVSENLGSEKGRSIYLNQLFPGSPAKLVAKLAGLPKPKNCI